MKWIKIKMNKLFEQKNPRCITRSNLNVNGDGVVCIVHDIQGSTLTYSCSYLLITAFFHYVMPWHFTPFANHVLFLWWCPTQLVTFTEFCHFYSWFFLSISAFHNGWLNILLWLCPCTFSCGLYPSQFV